MTADHYIALILLTVSAAVTAYIFIDEHRKARAQKQTRPPQGGSSS